MKRVFKHVKNSGNLMYMCGSKDRANIGDILEFRSPDGSLSRFVITNSCSGCLGCHFERKALCPVQASRVKGLRFESNRVGTRYVYLRERYFCSRIGTGTDTILVSIDDIVEDI